MHKFRRKKNIVLKNSKKIYGECETFHYFVRQKVRQNLDKFQSSLDDRNLVGLENTVGHVI